jgi:hypothetical protein
MHLILHWLGIDNVSGYAYAFWSGFGGDLTIVISFLTAPILLFRKHNCGVKWCWRIARHDYADPETGIIHHLCRKHHPDHPGSKITAAEIRKKHRLYIGAQPGKG